VDLDVSDCSEKEVTSLKEQAVSGVKWTSMSTVITVSVQFLQLAVLARLLSPEHFGLMGMVLVVIGFAQTFGDMGVSNALIHHQDATRDQLSSLYWLNMLSGIVVFVLVWMATPLVVGFYDEPQLKGMMFWASLIFLITPIGQQFQILLQKELRFNQLAWVEVASVTLGAIVATLSAVSGQGAFSLVWGQLALATTKVALLAKIGLNTWRPSLRFRRDDLKGYISFGLYQMGERSVNYFSWNMDKLLIGKLLGAEALGFYSVAYQLVIRPLFILNPTITQVAFPVLSKVQTDDTRLKRGYLRMIQAVAFVSMPVYLGMFAVAYPLLDILLGSGWGPAVDVFQVLVLLGVFYSLGNPLGSLLLAKGRADVGFWMNLFALPVYAAAIFIGSQWAVYGVAWALVMASAGILFPLEFWIRWRLVRMLPLEFVKSFAPYLAFSVLMAVVVMVVDRLVKIDYEIVTVQLGVLVAVGVTIYLGSIWLFKRSLLKEILSMVRAKPPVSGEK
jgi:lipopolysaccharide exporter